MSEEPPKRMPAAKLYKLRIKHHPSKRLCRDTQEEMELQDDIDHLLGEIEALEYLLVKAKIKAKKKR